MKNRLVMMLLVMVLLVVSQSVWTSFAGAENITETEMDVSAYILQAGGFLPVPGAQTLVSRSGAYDEAKEVVLSGLQAREGEIDISEYHVPETDLTSVYTEVINDNPELFYVTGGCSYYSDGFYLTRILPEYDPSYTENDERNYHNTVQRILNMMESGWSDVEKALFLHDYLVTHCEYDTSLRRRNAHDALVVGSAVCQGYTLAFQDLCLRCGINSMVVTSKKINHAWNLVTVGGARFYVDCTWDDPTGGWYESYCAHKNFLLSRSAFYESHNRSTDWVSGTVNVYESVETSEAFDNFWWKDVTTPVARVGSIAAYTDQESTSIYLRNMNNGSVTPVPLPDNATWHVWGNSYSFWSGNFSAVAAMNGRFYFTMPEAIWSLTPEGETSCVYRLSEDELNRGYIYGIVRDGSELYYNLGTAPSNGNFDRTQFVQGPITGEKDGFTYQVQTDGTVSITGCEVTGEVVIPSTLDGYQVTSLADQLFSGAEDVVSVTIPETVTGFGDDSTNHYSNIFAYCSDLAGINVAAGNPAFCSVDGVLFSKDRSVLISYPCSRNAMVYHTEAGTLCSDAFASSENLRFLFLDNTDSTWDTQTFYDTAALTVFYIPGGNAEQKAAEEMAAGHIQDGSSQNPWCTLVSTLELAYLPEDLETIEEMAFQNTTLRYVIVPQECQRIEENAFAQSGILFLSVGRDTVIVGEESMNDVVIERR